MAALRIRRPPRRARSARHSHAVERRLRHEALGDADPGCASAATRRRAPPPRACRARRAPRGRSPRALSRLRDDIAVVEPRDDLARLTREPSATPSHRGGRWPSTRSPPCVARRRSRSRSARRTAATDTTVTIAVVVHVDRMRLRRVPGAGGEPRRKRAEPRATSGGATRGSARGRDRS